MTNEYYFWLSLIENKYSKEFIENYEELRDIFKEESKKYVNLKIHDGNLLPRSIVVFSGSVPSCKYCMAKTSEEFKLELEGLKQDLIKKGLEKKLIGPTNDKDTIKEYLDNFEIQRIYNRE